MTSWAVIYDYTMSSYHISEEAVYFKEPIKLRTISKIWGCHFVWKPLWKSCSFELDHLKKKKKKKRKNNIMANLVTFWFGTFCNAFSRYCHKGLQVHCFWDFEMIFWYYNNYIACLCYPYIIIESIINAINKDSSLSGPHCKTATNMGQIAKARWNPCLKK